MDPVHNNIAYTKIQYLIRCILNLKEETLFTIFIGYQARRNTFKVVILKKICFIQMIHCITIQICDLLVLNALQVSLAIICSICVRCS